MESLKYVNQTLLFPTLVTNNYRIKPTAHGKKLWRVQRTQGPAHHETNTSRCLQSSLKITASGQKFSTKKPQLKRPKNKPGMPKDFVFVDLSPVKDDDTSNDGLSLPPSPSLSDNSDSNDSLMTNDTCITDISFNSLMNEDHLQYYDFDQDYASSEDQMDFGLGLLNFDEKLLLDTQAFESPIQNHNISLPSPTLSTASAPAPVLKTPEQSSKAKFETPVDQILKTPEILHVRSKSVDSIKKKPLQFKTYSPKVKGSKIKKSHLRHRHTVSEPIKKQDLDDFLSLNNQIKVTLQDNDELSNLSSLSDDEILHQPFRSDMNCGINQFLTQKQEEFDLSAFISI